MPLAPDYAAIDLELRLALAALGPSPAERQHAIEHARTATLLLSSSPGASILGACGRGECYERISAGKTLVAAVRTRRN